MLSEHAVLEEIHEGDARAKDRRALLSFYRERCRQKEIDPATSDFKIYSAAEFQAIKNESVKCYAYSNRFFMQIKEYSTTPGLGFALFNETGCLLKLYGSKSFFDWCAERHIAPATDWSEESIGANAVSIGLERKEAFATVGQENFCRALSDVAVYFSPYILNNNRAVDETILFGGIAILLPAELQDRDYLMLAVAAANDVALHLFMSDSIYEVHTRETKGLVSIDINQETGRKHVLYHNSRLFHILGINYENLYFKSTDVLFDPLPRNEAFWSIVEKGEEVSELPLKISVKGIENTYIVSTETYQQKHLNFRGIRFFITSSKDISSNVSRRIGNNALMTFHDILGNHSKFTDCLKFAKTIAKSDSNVLLLGESGVGKDIIAQAIHNASDRSDKPFIVVNCAALPRDLIASELFGYEGGAFTGSKKNGNIGKFELANSGTVFLDEIGDMPLDLQATLLRVIEQKSFMRLGSSTVTSINVKVIAATNANIMQLVEQKKFRADLYYRFTLRLSIPPLRERGDDVILLAEHFIRSISARIQRPSLMTLSEGARDLLCHLPWAGNVRELQNLIEGIVQLYPLDVIEPKFIKEYLGLPDSMEPPPAAVSRIAFDGTHMTADVLKNALLVNHYNKTKTAEYLGISRKTLYRRMEELSLRL